MSESVEDTEFLTDSEPVSDNPLHSYRRRRAFYIRMACILFWRPESGPTDRKGLPMNSGIIQAPLRVVVLVGLSIGCGVCIAEEAEEAKSDDEFPSPLPVYVLPYYHSKGPWVSVGKFSSEPKSAASESILRVARQMTKDWQPLTLEQMHVTAIRLFDLGHRDEAVYWFQ